jgi:hypothetical protein
MARKSDDRQAAIGCSDCHRCVDGVEPHGFTRDERRLFLLDGVVRTQQIWITEGMM